MLPYDNLNNTTAANVFDIKNTTAIIYIAIPNDLSAIFVVLFSGCFLITLSLTTILIQKQNNINNSVTLMKPINHSSSFNLPMAYQMLI